MVKLIERILGIPEHGDAPRADLMLPNSILYIGVVTFFIGIAVLIYTVANFDGAKLFATVSVFAFAVGTIFWWKNTTIKIIDTHSFEVSKFIGKTKTYRFDEITGYQRSYNFIEIHVGNEKFNIDSTALMTQRLKTLFNRQLNKEVF